MAGQMQWPIICEIYNGFPQIECQRNENSMRSKWKLIIYPKLFRYLELHENEDDDSLVSASTLLDTFDEVEFSSSSRFSMSYDYSLVSRFLPIYR